MILLQNAISFLRELTGIQLSDSCHSASYHLTLTRSFWLTSFAFLLVNLPSSLLWPVIQPIFLLRSLLATRPHYSANFVNSYPSLVVILSILVTLTRLHVCSFTVIKQGNFFEFFWIFKVFIQHSFICRPSDSNESEDAGIEPMTVATLASASQTP